MKKKLLRMCLDYCIKQACKYHYRVETIRLLDKELDFIRAVGSSAIHRDKWLERIKFFQDKI